MKDRKERPSNWDELACACKDAAGWRCAFCNVAQEDERFSLRSFRYYRVYLHAAHKNQNDKANPKPELICLCPTCHAVYDTIQRQHEEDVRIHRIKHVKRIARLYISKVERVMQELKLVDFCEIELVEEQV